MSNSLSSAAPQDIRSKLRELGQQFPELDRVEEVISSKLTSDIPLLEEIPNYLLSVGGKRIRPLLCLIVGRCFGVSPQNPQLIRIAAGIELIHMASLLHDDIIDNAKTRRHKPSAIAKFGKANALLAGDFLFVRAFGLCAELDPFIIEATERACVELTEGEVAEGLGVPQDASHVTHSLRVAKKKTASLFILATRSAAYLAGADTETLKQAELFGCNLGIAFQIVDDVLDVESEESKLGKSIGADIQEKKPSSVNAFWLESGSPLAKEVLLGRNGAELSQKALSEAMQDIRDSGALGKAKSLAHKHTDQAEKHFETCMQLLSDARPEFQNQVELMLHFVRSRLS